MLCEKILAFWQVTTDSDCSSTIVPDGCRDLIMHQPAGQATTWFVSPLFDKLSILELAANSRLYGFRLQPGASIDEVKLLASLPLTPLAPLDIQDRIDCYCTYDKNIAQALSCLATETASVPIAAKLLGVSMRTLQRHIFKTTQRTPAYWLQLARVRKAARALNSSLELIEIAETFGYSDQAHMNREFKRWFHMSPKKLKKQNEIFSQLFSSGYDGTVTGEQSSIKKPLVSET